MKAPGEQEGEAGTCSALGWAPHGAGLGGGGVPGVVCRKQG